MMLRNASPAPASASASTLISGIALAGEHESAIELNSKTDPASRLPRDHHAAADTPEPSGDWIEGIPLIMVITAVTIVVFVMLLDTSIISTAIPQITNEFSSLDDVGWYGSAYTIASASLQTLTGKVYTYFTSKWIFLVCFVIFELGSLVCGLATSSTMLIIGRAVAGIGSAGLMSGGLNIVAGAVPMHRRPIMLGIIMGIGQLGLVCGPLLGGAFTTYATWRWCFYINLPIGGLVALLLLFTRVPDQHPKGKARHVLRSLSPVRDLDLIGFAFFASASVQLLLALQYGGNQYAWNSATVVGLFCGAAATFGVMTLWEWYMDLGSNAIIPGNLLGQRIIWSSCLMGAMVYGMTMILSYYLPLYFQTVRGESALVSGVDLLPNIVCQMVMAITAGALTSKLGYYLPWGVVGAVLNAVGCGLLSTLTPHTSVPDWAGYQSLVGFGRGAASQVPMIAIQNAVSPSELSTGMAMVTFSQMMGGAIFLAVAEALFSHGLRDHLEQYAPAVDADAVVNAGATGFRSVVPASELPAVLVAYSKSVNWVFYLAAGLCVIQAFSSLGVGWKSVKKPKQK